MHAKILFLDWNSYGNEDIILAVNNLNKEGHDLNLVMYPFDNHTENDDKEFIDAFKTELQNDAPDFVMSFNYHPAVSIACNDAGVKYASWVYDNPASRLFSYTLVNTCNYVFLFDSQIFELFASQGIKTVYYLPLASAVSRYDKISISEETRKKWGGKISFVGSLYNESHNYYDQMEPKLSEYCKGYLNGLIRTQLEINGADIVEKNIPENILKEMVAALGAKPNSDGVETYEYIYSNYVINRKITSIERKELLELIGTKYEVNLFTKDRNFSPKGINNFGEIDYYNDMPYIFNASDINLNITLRSIQRGIPLRAMDILGCGGFLLTNYQDDFLKFFSPGEDFVYYESRSDLMDKIDYYLSHDDERRAIARHGHDSAKAYHTYEQRLEEIINVVMG